MEKCFSRQRSNITGLLALLICSAITVLPIFADESDTKPQVSVAVSSMECVAGEPVTLKIAVLYNNLSDVSIDVSPLPAGIISADVSYVRRPLSVLMADSDFAHLVDHFTADSSYGTQALVRTSVLRCSPTGKIDLGLVTVIAGDHHEMVRLPLLTCHKNEEIVQPTLYWDLPPKKITAGKQFVAQLHATNLPTGAILNWEASEGLYVQNTDSAMIAQRGFCQFFITPLFDGKFSYPSATVSWQTAERIHTVSAEIVTIVVAPNTQHKAGAENCVPETVFNEETSVASGTVPVESVSDIELLLEKNRHRAAVQCCIALFFCIVFALLLFRGKESLRFIMLGLLICALFATGFCGRHYVKLNSSLVSNSCRLYFIPDTEHGTYTDIAPGMILEQKKKAGTWLYVRTPDGRTGWIPTGGQEKE